MNRVLADKLWRSEKKKNEKMLVTIGVFKVECPECYIRYLISKKSCPRCEERNPYKGRHFTNASE